MSKDHRYCCILGLSRLGHVPQRLSNSQTSRLCPSLPVNRLGIHSLVGGYPICLSQVAVDLMLTFIVCVTGINATAGSYSAVQCCRSHTAVAASFDEKCRHSILSLVDRTWWHLLTRLECDAANQPYWSELSKRDSPRYL